MKEKNMHGIEKRLLTAIMAAFMAGAASADDDYYSRYNSTYVYVDDEFFDIDDDSRFWRGLDTLTRQRLSGLDSEIEQSLSIIELQDKVVSLQDQIDLLTAGATDIEERITVNESAIVLLRAENARLQVLIDQNATSISVITNEISHLQQRNVELEILVATNSGDIQFLQQEIDANALQIAALNNAVADIQQNQLTVQQALQAQISANGVLLNALSAEVEALGTELAQKQDLVTGTCPDGAAIREILADGTVICQQAGGGGSSGQLEVVTALRVSSQTPPGGFAFVFSSCPSGYVASSAGFDGVSGWGLYGAYTGANYGLVYGRNNNQFADTFTNRTVCMGIAP